MVVIVTTILRLVPGSNDLFSCSLITASARRHPRPAPDPAAVAVAVLLRGTSLMKTKTRRRWPWRGNQSSSRTPSPATAVAAPMADKLLHPSHRSSSCPFACKTSTAVADRWHLTAHHWQRCIQPQRLH